MKKHSNMGLILSLIAFFAAVSAVAVAFVLYLERKRETLAQMKQYVESSIV